MLNLLLEFRVWSPADSGLHLASVSPPRPGRGGAVDSTTALTSSKLERIRGQDSNSWQGESSANCIAEVSQITGAVTSPGPCYPGSWVRRPYLASGKKGEDTTRLAASDQPLHLSPSFQYSPPPPVLPPCPIHPEKSSPYSERLFSGARFLLEGTEKEPNDTGNSEVKSTITQGSAPCRVWNCFPS